MAPLTLASSETDSELCERTAERYLLELMNEGLLTRQHHSFLYQYRLTDVGREKIAA